MTRTNGTREPQAIYVELLDEGTDVWRPVQAIEVAPGRFRIVADQAYDRESERWAFEPGALVECEWMKLSGGPTWVAVRRASESDRGER